MNRIRQVEPSQERQCYTVEETMTNTTRESCHPEKRNGEVPDGMEADQQQADEDQNEGEVHQHHHHPVLCTNQQQ